MKIIDVNPFFYPYNGGIENRMYGISRLMAAKGHDVTVLTGRLSNDSPEEEKIDGFRIIRLKSMQIKIYNPPFIASEGILETLKNEDPDIVNYNYRWAPSYNRALAKYDGKKVFTYHNMWGEGDGIIGKISEINDNRFAKDCLSTFDHTIAVSAIVRNDLIRRGYGKKYVTTVPSCFNGEINPGDGSGDFALSLGRLVRTKGLDYLIEAMKDVDHKLVICGEGPDFKRLEKAIAKAGLVDRIELRGYVSEEEKMRLMGECRFFVMPSLHETLGLAAEELMSRGRPIICSDADGLPDTVGDAGYVVPKADAKTLAKAMNEMFRDREKCESLAAKTADRIKYYDWDIHLPKIEEVCSKVLSGEYTKADSGKIQ